MRSVQQGRLVASRERPQPPCGTLIRSYNAGEGDTLPMAEPEQVPDIVYHYTSIDTMMKIVASESIWATSVCYLNDTSEQSHFLNLVRSRIPHIKFATSEEREAAESFLNVQEGGFANRPFIASFSAEADSLPQWRSYCNAGNGVAIGFSSNCLRRATIKTDKSTPPFTRFDRVRYPDASNGYPEIDAEIIEQLETVKMTIEVMKITDAVTASSLTLSELFRFMLLEHACFRKSASFRSENEYRLVVDTIIPRYDLLRYRTTRSCMIPYLDLKIPHYEEGHDKDPDFQLSNPSMGGFDRFIKRVVVGPTPHKDLTLETVRAFFWSNLILVDVVPSNVSFRDW